MTVARAPGAVVLQPKAKPIVHAAEEPRVRVRIWDRVVRWTHWLIVGSLIVLSATGLYIGRPFFSVSGPAGESFVMGYARVIHMYAAIVFSMAVFARLIWMFTGTRHARWWNFLPVTRVRQKGALESLKFYLFLRRTPPPFAGHNPLAGLAYLGVFGLYLLLIATGLGLYAVSAHVESPFRGFLFLNQLFGGAQQARWIHHVTMWLLLLFTLQHVYSAILVALVEKNGALSSILSGNKRLLCPEAEQELEAQRRFEQQGGHE
jgi:Ni/Fe-hydrogenase 1 B-type cytochrome subunit